MDYYNTMFVLLRKQDEFTDEDIDEFQRLADYYYSTWIELHQAKGITNYII
jgi:hypothetical protein